VKVLTFATHPIQYQAPLFGALQGSGAVDLEVCYYTRYDGTGSTDPGFGREVVWDIPARPASFRQFHAWGERAVPERARTFSPASVAHALHSRPDVVLLHSGLHAGDIAILMACRAKRIPTVCRPETLTERPPRSLAFAARRVILRSADAFCAIGSRARRRLLEAGIPASRIAMSPYTVDVERFASTRPLTRHQARAFIGLPDDLPIVLFAGKLTERKRPLDVVRALKLLRFPVRLVIAGTGRLSSQLAAEALSANVPLVELGFVNQSQIPHVYRAADVLSLPSAWEPWGLAVNEAMACGTPAVCSNGVSSADDLVRPVSEQLVHTVGDAEALASALELALQNDSGVLEDRVVQRIDGWTYREAVAGLLRAFDLAVAAHA
jgi:glycosyltransferase involved in cell wall biosynthesis